jgi:hypothetical protein
MIDNPQKTESLIAAIKKVLPVQAYVTPYLKNALAGKEPRISMPDRCDIIEIIYAGDMGGILCRLDVGGVDAKTPVVVSITHLTFGRTVLLAREIEAYQKHRIKKLKQQSRGS